MIRLILINTVDIRCLSSRGSFPDPLCYNNQAIYLNKLANFRRCMLKKDQESEYNPIENALSSLTLRDFIKLITQKLETLPANQRIDLLNNLLGVLKEDELDAVLAMYRSDSLTNTPTIEQQKLEEGKFNRGEQDNLIFFHGKLKFEVNCQIRRITIANGTEISIQKLSTHESIIFATLLKANGIPVPKNHLFRRFNENALKKIYSYESNTVEVALSRLREKLYTKIDKLISYSNLPMDIHVPFISTLRSTYGTEMPTTSILAHEDQDAVIKYGGYMLSFITVDTYKQERKDMLEQRAAKKKK